MVFGEHGVMLEACPESALGDNMSEIIVCSIIIIGRLDSGRK